MLYRALDNLSNGVRRWQVFNAARMKENIRAILEARGAIAPVSAPPLYGVEGWQTRAEILSDAGFETLADIVLFSGVPAGVEAVVWAQWQAEAAEALSIKCLNCRR